MVKINSVAEKRAHALQKQRELAEQHTQMVSKAGELSGRAKQLLASAKLEERILARKTGKKVIPKKSLRDYLNQGRVNVREALKK
ncbi:MAG: hypothetical protein WC915_04780 [archaeon]|jgi:hypothetical protein